MLTARLMTLGAALLMVASVVVLGTPAAEAAAPARILLVGDSITEGTGGDTSYRCDLWNALGGAVDFIGTRSDSFNCGSPGFDADHAAQGGITTADWVDNLGPAAFALSYDAALVHIGTNDVNGVDFDWTQTYVNGLEVEYRNLIAGLRQNNPKVSIYLPQIIPCRFDPNPTSGYLGCDVTHNGGLDNNGQPVEGMNDVWARIAGDSSTANSPIVLVDHRNGFSLSDLKADGVHPNATGRAKMAAKWATALSRSWTTRCCSWSRTVAGTSGSPGRPTARSGTALPATSRCSGTGTETACPLRERGGRAPAVAMPI